MNSWKYEKLGEGIEVKHGFAFKGEFFKDHGQKILITPGNFHEEGGFKYTPGKEKFYVGDFPQDYVCSKGDLVVAMTEQTPGLLGSTALVPEDDKFLHNQRIGLISFDEFKYDKLFLYYLFQTESVRKQIALSSSGSKVKHTSPKRIYDVKIQKPPLSIQREIGKFLLDLDAKIEVNNKINKELEAMAKTLYDYWFVQFDFPYDFEKGKPDINGKPYKSSGGKMVYNEELKREIPEGWEVKDLQDIIEIERGISYKSSEIKGGGIPMINLNSFNLDGTYKETGIKMFSGKKSEKKMAKPGDLLIAVTDVTRDAHIIGKSILVPDYYDELVYSMDIAKIIPKNRLTKTYLKMLFNSDHYHNYIKWFASGTIVLHLNMDGMKWYNTEIPPKHLIDQYDDIYKNVENRISSTTKQNKKLAELRDWLLPMLMNGQVSVGEAEERLSMVAEKREKYREV